MEGGRDICGGEPAAVLASDLLQLGQKLALVQAPWVFQNVAVAATAAAAAAGTAGTAAAPSQNVRQSLVVRFREAPKIKRREGRARRGGGGHAE